MKTLIMDPSSRVPYILGQDTCVETSKMTSVEWLVVIKKAVDLVKPRLKYLPFRPIGEFTNSEEGFSKASIITPSDVVRFASENVSLGTRCSGSFLVLNYRNADERIEKSEELAPIWITRDEVRLTANGDFVYWSAAYKGSVRPGCENPNEWKDCIFTAINSHFKILCDVEVQHLIEIPETSFLDVNKFTRDFFNVLQYSISSGRKKTEERAEKLKSTEESFMDIRRRAGLIINHGN